MKLPACDAISRDVLSHDGEIGIYKGKKYKVLWRGQTKYGNRVKLGFFNGQSEFWASADAVVIQAGASTANTSPMERVYGRGRGGPVVKCKECGGWKAPGDPCNEPCD